MLGGGGGEVNREQNNETESIHHQKAYSKTENVQ